MTTLVEVARRAGVSKSTVSNVIHGHISVAEPTRRRVERAIGELGYRPNAIARSLRVRTTNTSATEKSATKKAKTKDTQYGAAVMN